MLALHPRQIHLSCTLHENEMLLLAKEAVIVDNASVFATFTVESALRRLMRVFFECRPDFASSDASAK